jgi:tetratricopeptide (TPR) repeat protein
LLRRTDLLRVASFAVAWLALQAQPTAAEPPASEPNASPSEAMARSTTTDDDMVDLQARSHFRSGREFYRLGRFRDAAAEFEVAHGLSGRGALLYNVYISYREAGDTPKAAAALRGYLAAVPDAPDHANLTVRLQVLEAQVAESAAGAEREQAQRAEVERLRREAEARAATPAPAPAQTAATPSRPWWPWLVVGAGVAATATGLTLGALASSDADALRAQCVADPRTEGATAPLITGTACAPGIELDDRRSSIQTQALVGDVLWIGGAALVVTGVVLALVLPPSERAPEPPPLTAACGPRSCQANLQLRF